MPWSMYSLITFWFRPSSCLTLKCIMKEPKNGSTKIIIHVTSPKHYIKLIWSLHSIFFLPVWQLWLLPDPAGPANVLPVQPLNDPNKRAWSTWIHVSPVRAIIRNSLVNLILLREVPIGIGLTDQLKCVSILLREQQSCLTACYTQTAYTTMSMKLSWSVCT